LDGATSLVHGTCIALEGNAAILQGPSGVGKSDLALRCIMQPAHVNGRSFTASLVADDQVTLERRAASLWARPPATIAGKLEVRGLGIVDIPHAPEARLRLVVRLVGVDAVERLPSPAETGILGVMLPVVQVAPLETSAPLKVLLALLQASR
jgi:serine kinase of HPr protein (carbohydrate metabolism regulator)